VLQGEFVKWHWNEDELEMQWSLTVEESALLPGRTDRGPVEEPPKVFVLS